MKISSPLVNKVGGLLSAQLVRVWMSTLDAKVAYYDRAVDPVDPRCHGHKIYIFWHEFLLYPLRYRAHCNLSLLLSRHRDADILSRVALHMRAKLVRGSTKRGGSAALRELFRESENGHVAITPDGPRGPRRRLAQGPVYLSSKLGIPIVCMGLGYDRPWRLGSWDRFAIPRPYSRARAVISPQLQIPPDLDRAGIERYRLQVETLLNRLTLEAEAWAESGTRKLGQWPVRDENPPLASRRIEPAEESIAAHHHVRADQAALTGDDSPRSI